METHGIIEAAIIHQGYLNNHLRGVDVHKQSVIVATEGQ